MPSQRALAVKTSALALGPEHKFEPGPAATAFMTAAPAMPARDLQALLGAQLASSERFGDEERRWSPRRMLAIAVGASALLWGALGVGAYLVIRSL